MERHAEEAEKQRAHELALKQLELSTAANSIVNSPAASAHPVAAPRSVPPFRVDAAVKLVPKLNESDIESFLIGFGKVAELNAFPKDKYAAVLQAHLTGKALKAFTELTTEQCRDYDTLKTALLDAYAVVPEVYRRHFRTLTKHQGDTYSKFALKLGVQFCHWAESEDAYEDVDLLRELILLEQLNDTLDSELRM